VSSIAEAVPAIKLFAWPFVESLETAGASDSGHCNDEYRSPHGGSGPPVFGALLFAGQAGQVLDRIATEQEWAGRATRHLKAELKRADLTYDDLAEGPKKHGFKETKASIANKLAGATVPASLFLACLAAMELEG
jgi:hypothetical protein